MEQYNYDTNWRKNVSESNYEDKQAYLHRCYLI